MPYRGDLGRARTGYCQTRRGGQEEESFPEETQASEDDDARVKMPDIRFVSTLHRKVNKRRVGEKSMTLVFNCTYQGVPSAAL